MLVMRDGLFEYLQPAKDCATVLKGDCVCEPVLWCRWKHTGELITKTYGEMFEIPIENVESLVDRYPPLSSWARTHAVEFVEQINQNDNPSDLFDSHSSLHMKVCGNKQSPACEGSKVCKLLPSLSKSA